MSQLGLYKLGNNAEDLIIAVESCIAFFIISVLGTYRCWLLNLEILCFSVCTWQYVYCTSYKMWRLSEIKQKWRINQETLFMLWWPQLCRIFLSGCQPHVHCFRLCLTLYLLFDYRQPHQPTAKTWSETLRKFGTRDCFANW